MTRLSPLRELNVVAAALFDGAGRVLVAQRPTGKHMAGRWELPGGKLEPGETPLEALKRELAEELGVDLRDAERLIRLRHDYPDRRVVLDVWRVTAFDGEPRGLDGQALEWVLPDRLPAIDILEADLPIVTALRLPCVARMAVGVDGLRRVAAAGQPLALLWNPATTGRPDDAACQAVRAARAAGHRVLVVGDEVAAVTVAAITGADGVALEWTGEPLALDSRGQFLAGVLCDSALRAAEAARAGAQFVIVTPPAAPLDGATLARLCEQAGVPVLSGWYQGLEALPRVRSAGAHGCVIGAATQGE